MIPNLKSIVVRLREYKLTLKVNYARDRAVLDNYKSNTAI